MYTCTGRGRIGAVVLMMTQLIETHLDWLNERLRLEAGRGEVIEECMFYRFLPIFLISLSSYLNMEVTIGLFRNVVKSFGRTNPYHD